MNTKIGHYRILEPIGSGGMATVYRAYQETMDRVVAIKIMAPELGRDEHFGQRFQQEAHIIAKLEHRHIVPVYDYGQQNGITYLVMRYLQAGTLKDVLTLGALPIEAAARIVSQVAAALGYAHSQGVIHRDVKPSNILVDKDGYSYLTDFGIAKVLQGSLHLTNTGEVLGTPAYMSPEQALGRVVTPQSDVYSLGITLYELATGRPPFEGDTPVSTALMHVTNPPPPPRDINPAVSDEVASVIVKALAKDPAERYPSVEALAQALQGSYGVEPTAQPAKLIEMAGAIAIQKSREEVTSHVREQVRHQINDERWQRLLRLAPLAVSGLIILALVVGIFRFWNENTRLTASAAETATAVADLLEQLAGAQTAVAAGNAEFQPTLRYLETQVAGIGEDVNPSISSDTPTVIATRTPSSTPSATASRTNTLTRTRVPPSPTVPTDTSAPPVPTDTSAPPEQPGDVPAPPPTNTPEPYQPPTAPTTSPPTSYP